ncbi:MAG: YitT family protein [Lachnospiraceae bacterium]
MNLSGKKMKILDVILILLGSALVAASSVMFLDPAGMVIGGFSGIAIIVKRVSAGVWPGGIPLWVTNLVLNLVLVPICWKVLGKKFIVRTAFGFLCLTFWLAVIPPVTLGVENDSFITALFGAILMGAGSAMIFLARSTTGGTDMCGALLQHWFPHLSIARLMQVLDIIIVLSGLPIFGVRNTLYAASAAWLSARISDILIDGLKYSKMVLIISDKADIIASEIMEKMDRGVTGLSGEGMYTRRDKTVLMCVMQPREVVQLKEIVSETDPDAFIIVNDSREVLGEGFPTYNQ